MASTAIPIVFPAVPIGGTYYGDGSVRTTSPFSPAIHLGAKQILAVGTRKVRPAQSYVEALTRFERKPPTLAAIFGSLLNAVFLDALDADLERLDRINHTLTLIPRETPEKP